MLFAKPEDSLRWLTLSQSAAETRRRSASGGLGRRQDTRWYDYRRARAMDRAACCLARIMSMSASVSVIEMGARRGK